MKNNNLMETARELFEEISSITGFKIKEEIKNTSRTINIFEYDTQQSIVQCYNYISLGDGVKAIAALHSDIADQSSKLSHLVTEGKMKEFTRVSDYIVRLKDAYKESKKIFDEANKCLLGTGIFDSKDLSEIDLSYDLAVDKHEFGGFKIHLYKKGRAFIPSPSKITFTIGANLIISSNLTDFLQTLSFKKMTDDRVTVSLFLKLEKRVEQSYFVFVFSYKDYIWVAHDKPRFYNPRNKATTRGHVAERNRHRKYEDMELPYDIVWELDELRKKERKLAVSGAPGVEVLRKPIKELSAPEKYFIITLVRSMVTSLSPDLSEITTAGSYIERKLLSCDKMKVNNSNFEGHDKETQGLVDEIKGTLGISPEPSRELVVRDYSLVKSSKDFDPNWLATTKELETLSQWHVLEKEREKIQNRLNTLEKRGDKDQSALDSMFDKNMERIASIGFMADEIDFVVDLPVHNFATKFTPGLTRIGFFDKPRPDKEHRGLFSGAINWTKECMCPFCKLHKYSFFKLISIRHWSQLVLLLGLKNRMELPKYFRGYRAHNFVPYRGNSILDNTHPMAMLEDPASECHPNGIHIRLIMCGYCAKYHLPRKYKKHDGLKLVDSIGAVRNDLKNLKRCYSGVVC